MDLKNLSKAELRKIAKAVDNELRNKPQKASFTLSLPAEDFKELQAFVKKKKIGTTSEVVGTLISEYLNFCRKT